MIGRIVIVAVNLVTLVVLARLITPEVFGIVAVAMAIATFMSGVVNFGLPTAVAQADAVSPRAHSALFLVNAGIGLILGAALFLLSTPLATLYDQPELLQVIAWISLVPLFEGLAAQFRARLMREFRFGSMSLLETVSQIVASALSIVLALRGEPFLAVVALSVTSQAIQLVGLVALARWVPGTPGAWRSEVSPLLRVGASVFGLNLNRNLSRTLVIPVIGLWLPPAAVGAYDRANQITSSPVRNLVDILQRVAVPILARMRDTPNRAIEATREFHIAVVYGVALPLVILAAVAEPLVDVLFGPGWQVAGLCLTPLAIGAAFRAMAQPLQWHLVGASRSGVAFRLSLFTQPAVVALSLAGIPWGVVGVAVGNALGWVLNWALVTYVALRESQRPLETAQDAARVAGLVAMPAAAVALIITLTLATSWGSLVLAIAGAAATVVVAILTVPWLAQDRRRVTRLIQLARR